MSETTSNVGIRHVRRILAWYAPLSLLVSSFCYVFGVAQLMAMAQGIRESVPFVRIGVATLLTPIIILLSLITVAGLIAKALPANDYVIRVTVRLLEIIILLGAVVLMSLPAVSYLQHRLMPRWGYFECHELEGQPSLWFTDWVRNKDWCAKGKDQKWIIEQAKKSAFANAPR
ncbi:hypothetical protein [Acidovorax sp. NCPPB 4044]|uniref:hypothetical protein n=1 Tax=Acidovorax sp. NCPPB 4044 TaxID=2940490 RepID=UPI002302F88D|nr:hypothetical protein [Acidovorax sp. NCPPB 4044]MDA8523532.1 hypothetical protein [Acidovorax sp. NCPPB 4044]